MNKVFVVNVFVLLRRLENSIQRQTATVMMAAENQKMLVLSLLLMEHLIHHHGLVGTLFLFVRALCVVYTDLRDLASSTTPFAPRGLRRRSRAAHGEIDGCISRLRTST